MEFGPKTELQRLQAKERGIKARLDSSTISEAERAKAQRRLDETRKAIVRERESSRRPIFM